MPPDTLWRKLAVLLLVGEEGVDLYVRTVCVKRSEDVLMPKERKTLLPPVHTICDSLLLYKENRILPGPLLATKCLPGTIT